ncbi:hypothetical protein [Stenotrophomonas sp. 278]|uniref:hypothetical protein n=1 Tax=Stenotrophomonas sp. 278 TaxID=2479851 RepID=UPI000F6738AA|nr:hypothetical protein [Stenotrophomonas sp. 278]RRU23565.1 hypothetical protein EGJ34_02670 [Stenotrophomonas sp. 278]
MRALIFVLLTASAFASIAAEPLDDAQVVDSYQEVSAPGETLDSFMVRIAPKAVRYTNATGHRVCGSVIERSEGGYQVELRLSAKTHSCQLPADTTVYFATRTWGKGTFSESEREIPGYMATRNLLYHQSGKRERKVGKLGFW